MPVRYQKSDKRILGTWKSNRAKTMEFMAFKKGSRIGPKRRAEIAKIYGVLIWHFTPTRMYMEYEESKTVTKYRIIASDSTSLVLEWTEEIRDDFDVFDFDGSLLQIHFEGKNEMKILSGYNQEFFRRVCT